VTQKNCTPNSWQVNSRRFHLNKCCKMKRRFLHVWHGIDQTTSLTMQLMSGVDVFAHVCGQKADTSNNYCDNIFSQDAWKDSSPMTCCVSSVKPCLLIVQEYKMFVNEWQQMFQFLSNVSIFFVFFWKLPKFHTSDFRKVVWQHTEGMVGSITWVLLEIYLAFQQWKNLKIR